MPTADITTSAAAITTAFAGIGLALALAPAPTSRPLISTAALVPRVPPLPLLRVEGLAGLLAHLQQVGVRAVQLEPAEQHGMRLRVLLETHQHGAVAVVRLRPAWRGGDASLGVGKGCGNVVRREVRLAAVGEQLRHARSLQLLWGRRVECRRLCEGL